MASSTYHAPNRLRHPSSLALGTTWKLLTVPCRNVVKLVKRGLSELARSRVFIVLEPLKPHAGADLVNALGNLHIVRVGKQIPPVPHACGVIGPGRSDGPRGRWW